MKLSEINLKENIIAFIRGELGLRKGYDKYLRHIITVAVLIATVLYLFLKTEESLKQIEDNKVLIDDLRISHSTLHSKLVSFDRPSSINIKLNSMGSSIKIPNKPAIEIIK